MNLIAVELDQKLQAVDKDTAQRLERLVREAMDLAKPTPGGDDFERLRGDEDTLRARLGQAGRRFSARDRLTRDKVHDRDALR